MTAALIVGCGALGLVVGLVLNTIIDRVPDRRPLRPLPVACTACGDASTVLAGTVHGQCAGCGERRPLSERVVPVVTAGLFAAAAARFETRPWALIAYLVLFAMLVAVTVIDLRVFRIPDRIVFPTLAVSLPLVVAVSLIYDVPRTIQFALLGAAAYFLLLFVPHLIYPAGMGFGDVKLALVMGLYLGWLAGSTGSAVYLIFVAMMLGCVLGVVFGLGVRLATRRTGAFPFGPALAMATVVVVLFSEPIVRSYYG